MDLILVLVALLAIDTYFDYRRGRVLKKLEKRLEGLELQLLDDEDGTDPGLITEAQCKTHRNIMDDGAVTRRGLAEILDKITKLQSNTETGRGMLTARVAAVNAGVALATETLDEVHAMSADTMAAVFRTEQLAAMPIIQGKLDKPKKTKSRGTDNRALKSRRK